MKLLAGKKHSLILLLGLSLVVGNSALAGSATGNMQVGATVASSCQLTTNPLSFGTFTPTPTNTYTTANATVSTTCTKTTPFTLSLGSGSGTFTARTMGGAKTGNTDKLSYGLYTDSAATTVFGDGSTGTSNVSGTGTGSAIATTVYGKMSTMQFLTPDSYADNVTVTLSY